MRTPNKTLREQLEEMGFESKSVWLYKKQGKNGVITVWKKHSRVLVKYQRNIEGMKVTMTYEPEAFSIIDIVKSLFFIDSK